MDYHPLVEFPKYKIECNSLLKEYLDTNIFIPLKDKIAIFWRTIKSGYLIVMETRD